MKILICKDELANKLISFQNLPESDSMKYHVIENAPEIEEREKETGHYELNEAGEIVVVYTAKPQSLEEKIAEQDALIKDLCDQVNQIHQATMEIKQDK